MCFVKCAFVFTVYYFNSTCLGGIKSVKNVWIFIGKDSKYILIPSTDKHVSRCK